MTKEIYHLSVLKNITQSQITEKKEITNLLDNEIVFLSKQCLMNSQVIISTEISKKFLYENRFKQNKAYDSIAFSP